MREICTSGSVRDGDGNVPIYSALGVPNRRQMPPERGWFMKVAVRGEELQLTGGEGLFQIVQEEASKHLREHCDRKEEPRPAGDPAFTVQRDPAARNKKVNVRVVQQILSPGVQHTQEADLRAQMVWIGGDLTQGVRRRPEQDIVDNGLVLEGDDLDLLGHREHDVEVGRVEQFGPTVLEPLSPCETLAFRTVAISARVVGHPLMAAIAAPLDVTAESGGAATFDRDHGTPPRSGQRRAVPIAESGAKVAEYIRHFQPLTDHGTRRSGGNEVRHRGRHGGQRIQRTGGGADLAGGDLKIFRCGGQAAMAKQQLDGAQIGTGLQ